MKLRHKTWLFLTKRWAPLLAGGIALQVVDMNGCDPQVKATFLTGIQTSLTSLVTSVINALFTSLQASNGSTTQTTVKAIIHTASQWFV